MHVLLHELGHHHDRMTTRSRNEAARGESYAETYANRYADRIWEAYEAEFGFVSTHSLLVLSPRHCARHDYRLRS
jgi:hypothetical protein